MLGWGGGVVWSAARAPAAPGTPAAAAPAGVIDWGAPSFTICSAHRINVGNRVEVLPHRVGIILGDCREEGLVSDEHFLTHADRAVACLTNLHMFHTYTNFHSKPEDRTLTHILHTGS